MVAARIVRLVFLPAMVVLAGVGVAIAASDLPEASVAGVVLVAIGVSFAAERLAPYEPTWNRSLGDRWRDVLHAVVNEGMLVGSLILLPGITDEITVAALWPATWPFVAQVVLAVLLADLGITMAHWTSHRIGWLWRLHSVHHSVGRFYGFNGLMKHPLHQSVEALAGLAPLLLVGLTPDVAGALAVCVAIQLLLQHSNVDYATAGLGRWFAWNSAHRFHHVAASGEGDVNFGLFTSVWDRLLGTYRFDPSRRFTTADLGVAGRPDFPVSYLPQLVDPFRPRRGIAAVAPAADTLAG